MKDNKKLYYKILPMEGIFLGLNPRAVEYLMLFGEWVSIENINIKSELESMFGIVFAGEKENGEDFEIIGSVWGDKVIPTITYAHDEFIDKNGKKNKMPLYKYKMANFDTINAGQEKETTWSYELPDNRQSFLYDNMRLLCLTTDLENRLYEWSDREIELSEVLMEYEEGKF